MRFVPGGGFHSKNMSIKIEEKMGGGGLLKTNAFKPPLPNNHTSFQEKMNLKIIVRIFHEPQKTICFFQFSTNKTTIFQVSLPHRRPWTFTGRFTKVSHLARGKPVRSFGSLYPPGNDHISHLGKFGNSSSKLPWREIC